MTDPKQPVGEALAGHLEREAEAIVDRWIAWLQSRPPTRAVAALSRPALRDHIPPVVRAIATYLRSPVEAVRDSMLGHLETHATLRRRQGYELDELLTEFDGLAELLSEAIHRHLLTLDYGLTADVLEVLARFALSLRAIGFVTVTVYRHREAEQQEHSARLLEEFARTIAHELRSPLHTASLSAGLLRESHQGDQNAQQLRHLELLDSALGQLEDLLDHMRLLAFVEAGKTRAAQFARIGPLLADALEQLEPNAKQRRVRLAVEGEVPDVAVDHLAFKLALINVTHNAIKYSDPDKAERTVTVAFRQTETQHDMDRLVVTVVDNGLGIAPEYADRVFQRHVRAHPDAAEGTGLGLSIAQQLLHERGGNISLASQPGQGTTVTFSLPCHPGSLPGHAQRS